jgi:Mrp family chromosome partitioning ATPase
MVVTSCRLSPNDQHGLSGGSAAIPGATGSLLATLRRRLPIILITAIIVAGAVAGLSYRSRNSYQSTSELLFGQILGPDLNALGLTPVAVDAPTQAANDTALVASRRVAEQAARLMGPGVSVTSVQNDVAVTGGKTGDVVSVTATTHPATRAAKLANAYADAAVGLLQADQSRRAQIVAQSLTSQLATLSPSDRRSLVGVQLRTRVAQVKALETAGTGNPEIIQAGYVPSSPSGSPLEAVALGVVLGLLLGVGLALLREQADERLRHAEAVSAAFQAPVLATLPRSRALLRPTPFEKLPGAVMEALQMLHSNLRYGSGEPLHSVLITSSRGRQGKTTVAWNLAVAAASAGLSVLLVDADLRRSSVASSYGLRSFPGLAEVLSGAVSLEEVIQPVILAPDGSAQNGHGEPEGIDLEREAFDVVIAGAAPRDPSALLQSAEMTGLLNSVADRYDLVVVDTPPIAQVADAIALLRSVDGVLVVASARTTRGPAAERLRNQLQALDARVVGVVLNGGTGESSYGYVGRSAQRA